MQNRKLKLTTVLLMGTLILAGCTSETPNISKSNGHKTTTSKVSNNHHKSTTNDNKSDSLWNNDKDNKLESFINQWAPTMKQSYKKYDGHHSLKTSVGTIYPDDLSKVTVADSNASIGWSKDGEGSDSYNVVAIYNYDGTEPPLPNHITYFFAFHDGQPIVLVDQSRDGTPNLSETQNNDVRSAFSNIVAGKSAGTTNNSSNQATTSKKASSSQMTTDPNMIGLMLREMRGSYDGNGGQAKMEEYLSVSLEDGMYRIGTGTLASETPYKINGNTVTYYTKDFSHGDTDADAPLVPHDISLKDLESKYYSTDAQRQNIQDVASQMPAVSGE